MKRVWEIDDKAKNSLILSMMSGGMKYADKEAGLPGYLKAIYARDCYARFVDIFTGDIWSVRWDETAIKGCYKITSDRLYLVG